MSSWKKGRGKMGFMAPLLGRWQTTLDDTPVGRVHCVRHYEKTLGGKFIALTADWQVGEGKTYQERAMYGVGRDGVPAFWSFTSDGGTAQGVLADVTDMHPDAMGFEAEMPAGRARFGFWPEGPGFIWGADAKTKKGWSVMVRHPCAPLDVEEIAATKR